MTIAEAGVEVDATAIQQAMDAANHRARRSLAVHEAGHALVSLAIECKVEFGQTHVRNQARGAGALAAYRRAALVAAAGRAAESQGDGRCPLQLLQTTGMQDAQELRRRAVALAKDITSWRDWALLRASQITFRFRVAIHLLAMHLLEHDSADATVVQRCLRESEAVATGRNGAGGRVRKLNIPTSRHRVMRF